MSVKLKNFTLIEVLIALSILTMSVVSFSLLIGSAAKRTLRAGGLWENTHLLTQAVEYHMLNKANSNASIDERFFPCDDYKIECSFESPQGLPEDVEDASGGKALVAMWIVLKDKDGKILDSVVVERIIGGLDK